MTPTVLANSTGSSLLRAAMFQPLIDKAAPEFEINTQERMAAFLAQVGHESGGLRYLTEIWGPTPAQRRYEGRVDLGNTRPGDGLRFLGRGLIQITGRNNYAAESIASGIDFLANPQRLAEPLNAVRSAMRYWQTHGCNELADVGDYKAATRAVNGGYNGYVERVALWEKAKAALA